MDTRKLRFYTFRHFVVESKKKRPALTATVSCQGIIVTKETLLLPERESLTSSPTAKCRRPDKEIVHPLVINHSNSLVQQSIRQSVSLTIKQSISNFQILEDPGAPREIMRFNTFLDQINWKKNWVGKFEKSIVGWTPSAKLSIYSRIALKYIYNNYFHYFW